MLIYTGSRLAAPHEFKHACHVGPEQLLLFVTTMMVTLMTDLWVGVGAGLLLTVILHLKNGAPLPSLFRTIVAERGDGDTLHLEVVDSAVFTNYLGLSQRLKSADESVRRIVVDFKNSWVVDHAELAAVGLDERRSAAA